ncbi:hypothetical protein RM844_22090 [Streptomyces sp. DSM 44915]|uniref:Tetratricopeptide repeat protein n=1 Tax=Streptomyces chisholmiae TaxID=3075540 RepID=A0ABU2JVH3_9ACTN|nr:hypothetical protein [Streptomyces sp. DSM 44915]MDT0268980.1 hypothetical protein [Streptomyces sp. DSM 44915]
MARWFGRSRDQAGEPDAFDAAERLRLAHRDTGQPGLLDTALRAMLNAKDQYGEADQRHAASLSGLCMLYRQKWERDSDRGALNRSASYGRAAVELSPPGDSLLPRHMSALATTLQELYEVTRDPKDIDEAIALYRGCLDLVPPADPEHAGQQSNLANSLLRRAKYHPDPELLREAVELARAALRGTAAIDPMRAARLVNLGAALMSRVQAGSVSELVEAETVYAQAVRALPPTHPAHRQVQGTLQVVRDLRRTLGI